MSRELDNLLDDEGASRVRRVTRMLPAKGTLGSNDRQAAVEDVREYCKSNNISQTQLAHTSGVSATYISAVFSGNLDGIPLSSLDDVLRGLSDHIEDLAKAAAFDCGTSYVDTCWLARKMLGIATNCRALGGITVCSGGAGIGKSIVAQAIAKKIRGSAYVLVTRGCNSPVRLTQALWRAVSTRNHAQKTPYAELVTKLRNSGRLLLIDQAHRLSAAGLETIMDIHTECYVPVMLIGTRLIQDRVSADNDPFFGQLSSRIADRVDLMEGIIGDGRGRTGKKLATPAQILQMFRSEQLRLHPDAARALAHIGNTRIGFLRTAHWVFIWACEFAKQRGQRLVTADLVDLALQRLDPSQRLDIAAIDQEDQQEAAAAS